MRRLGGAQVARAPFREGLRVSGEGGAAAIEFAIVLPVLALLVCGIIEFGLIFYNKQLITNASREGARAGIVQGADEGSIRGIVTQVLRETDGSSKILSLSGRIPIAGDNVGIARDGEDLAVAVGFDYPFVLGGIIGIPSTRVSAQTTMRLEN